MPNFSHFHSMDTNTTNNTNDDDDGDEDDDEDEDDDDYDDDDDINAIHQRNSLLLTTVILSTATRGLNATYIQATAQNRSKDYVYRHIKIWPFRDKITE